jgi:hypothetical protein
MAQIQSGRTHKLTERDCQVLKCIKITCSRLQHSLQSSNVSTITICREIHEMGFHGRAIAHKPKITMRNAKHRLEWCKARSH